MKYPGILTSLFPEDTGEENPNLKMNYAHASKETSSFQYPKNHTARPYMWAQWICGCYNLAPMAEARPEPSIRAVLTKLQERFTSHIILSTQLKQLNKSTPVATIHETASTLLDEEPSTKITSWTEMKSPPRSNLFGYPTGDGSMDKVPAINTADGNPFGTKYYTVVFKKENGMFYYA